MRLTNVTIYKFLMLIMVVPSDWLVTILTCCRTTLPCRIRDGDMLMPEQPGQVIRCRHYANHAFDGLHRSPFLRRMSRPPFCGQVGLGHRTCLIRCSRIVSSESSSLLDCLGVLEYQYRESIGKESCQASTVTLRAETGGSSVCSPTMTPSPPRGFISRTDLLISTLSPFAYFLGD